MTIDEYVEVLRLGEDTLDNENLLQLAEWLEELKLMRNLDKTNFSDGYNKGVDDCIDKFADILSNINEMCGRNCPVNCNWGTTTNCKDMCKKWLTEQLKE